VPRDPGVWTSDEDVVHGLHSLMTQNATQRMLQASASQTLCRIKSDLGKAGPSTDLGFLDNYIY
jgi:hypothetical protein